jgi:hypothetical protein
VVVVVVVVAAAVSCSFSYILEYSRVPWYIMHIACVPGCQASALVPARYYGGTARVRTVVWVLGCWE